MQKYIFLIRGSKEEPYGVFYRRIVDQCKTIALLHRPAALKLTLTSSPPPAISIIPFKKNRIAAISVTGFTGDLLLTIREVPGFAGGYSVQEALPVSYVKSWKDGEQSPGICLLTLFKKKKDIDYDTFIDRWHNSHTPLSLKLHPLWNYNRNVVREKVMANSEDWNGIVEEHFRTASDLLNPFRFFGNPLKIAWNMLQVYLDTTSFLDYKTIEPYLATEIHIIS
jgi:hypothetical protein